MTKLILSTGNIVSGGPSIIRKPGAYRSNLELTNSLRSSFLAAQQDYGSGVSSPASPPTSPNGHANGHTNGNGIKLARSSSRPSTSLWTAREPLPTLKLSLKEPNGTNGANGTNGVNGVNGKTGYSAHEPHDQQYQAREGGGEEVALFIPRVDALASGLLEPSSAYELTIKLFFLPLAPVSSRPAFVREALALVLRELGSPPAIDLLIASFPGLSFEGECEVAADKLNALQGNLDDEVATWRALEALHHEGRVRDLGIAEFGSRKLAAFLDRVDVKPAVNQINLRDCCSVPPLLVKLAKEKEIELLVHSDCTDVLPSGTLRELLGPGLQGAGVLAATPDEALDVETGGAVGGEEEGLKGELIPQWVVKYTAFVKDRGVIENKGYFAAAELRDG